MKKILSTKWNLSKGKSDKATRQNHKVGDELLL